MTLLKFEKAFLAVGFGWIAFGLLTHIGYIICRKVREYHASITNDTNRHA